MIIDQTQFLSSLNPKTLSVSTIFLGIQSVDDQKNILTVRQTVIRETKTIENNTILPLRLDPKIILPV